ncbi:MAG: hypothetical protein CMJ83_13305 [Planctomycetes bacterium]|nr:hypothetical protein [Planctomycetota bacterium]
MQPNKRQSHARRGQGGFSLIEVLISVTIIVLMGGVVAWNVFPALFQSQRDKAAMDIASLKAAVKMFQMREHRLPTEGDWPDFLFNGSDAHPDPYLDTDQFEDNEVKDPWKTEYVYKRISSREFEIISYGADMMPGGEGDDADISSKKSKK